MGFKKPDFSGWATRYNVLCTDGHTIKDGAFKHFDKMQVPLMWQHQYDSPENVLGHVLLEHRPEGVYAKGYLNDTTMADTTRKLLTHGDLSSLSIHARRLKKNEMDVLHGDIAEVSLVMGNGANPEAFIDYIDIQHGVEGESEAIIYSGELLHFEGDDEQVPSNEDTQELEDDPTIEEVLDTFNEDQVLVLEYLVDKALQEGLDEEDYEDEEETISASDEGTPSDQSISHSSKGTENMARNVFDQSKDDGPQRATLTHSQFNTILNDAKRMGSLRDSFRTHMADFGVTEEDVLKHADEDYGIQNINILFPDFQNTSATPTFIQRDTSWVDVFMSRTKKLPFTRIRSVVADITAEEARARGYITGNYKKEEVFPLLMRTTDPTTVYKKQKLDRDNLTDITSMDVVVWLKAEMRLMLNEEIARAGLLGDGRTAADEDHVADPKGQTTGSGIRSIANDHEMYSHQVAVPSVLTNGVLVERVLRSWTRYRGSGNTTFYTTNEVITDMLLEKDKVGRRLYSTVEELASTLRVNRIEPVEVMAAYPEIVGIIVDESDYSFGANKGGGIEFFDDFDLNYNQMLYLMETRLAGALTKPKSALIFKRSLDNEVVPTMPAFDTDTNTITIPTITGVEYLIDEEPVTGTVVIEENTEVAAYPTEGYAFPLGIVTTWNYTYTDEG